jgi:hypothetical protein
VRREFEIQKTPILGFRSTHSHFDMISSNSPEFDLLVNYYSVDAVDPLASFYPIGTVNPLAFAPEDTTSTTVQQDQAKLSVKKKSNKSLKRSRSDDVVLQDAIQDIERILLNLQSGDVSSCLYAYFESPCAVESVHLLVRKPDEIERKGSFQLIVKR